MLKNAKARDISCFIVLLLVFLFPFGDGDPRRKPKMDKIWQNNQDVLNGDTTSELEETGRKKRLCKCLPLLLMYTKKIEA